MQKWWSSLAKIMWPVKGTKHACKMMWWIAHIRTLKGTKHACKMMWWIAHIRIPKGIKHACKVMGPIDHIHEACLQNDCINWWHEKWYVMFH
jgi:hypothetical protein